MKWQQFPLQRKIAGSIGLFLIANLRDNGIKPLFANEIPEEIQEAFEQKQRRKDPEYKSPSGWFNPKDGTHYVLDNSLRGSARSIRKWEMEQFVLGAHNYRMPDEDKVFLISYMTSGTVIHELIHERCPWLQEETVRHLSALVSKFSIGMETLRRILRKDK